jgi:hypothetical protein
MPFRRAGARQAKQGSNGRPATLLSFRQSRGVDRFCREKIALTIKK